MRAIVELELLELLLLVGNASVDDELLDELDGDNRDDHELDEDDSDDDDDGDSLELDELELLLLVVSASVELELLSDELLVVNTSVELELLELLLDGSGTSLAVAQHVTVRERPRRSFSSSI